MKLQVQTISDCFFYNMNGPIKNKFCFKTPNQHTELTPPLSLTEFADSGVVSRNTPVSSIDEKYSNHSQENDDDGDQSVATEVQYLSNIHKRMVLLLRIQKCVFVFHLSETSI